MFVWASVDLRFDRDDDLLGLDRLCWRRHRYFGRCSWPEGGRPNVSSGLPRSALINNPNPVQWGVEMRGGMRMVNIDSSRASRQKEQELLKTSHFPHHVPSLKHTHSCSLTWSRVKPASSNIRRQSCEAATGTPYESYFGRSYSRDSRSPVMNPFLSLGVFASPCGICEIPTSAEDTELPTLEVVCKKIRASDF